MDVFDEYLARLEHPRHRARMEEVLSWVPRQFPVLVPKIAWNQPMYTDHGTFIIGFSAAKEHFAVSPERAGMIRFSDEIAQAGHDYTKQLIRIRWEQPVDYALLEKMIAFNIEDKADCATFWRK
ncbi:iron chaperone [Paenibacillus glycinis]|uniref:Iron chaperone n=1 Tax=Paenibacillus glycinis TaxID=2697035 RepID=A0ABW9XXD3_9BACL|nr:iron chaperone [Paenibacillus glycinis]NBD27377.1 iron chaperone [Paenibacillus glycinis]